MNDFPGRRVALGTARKVRPATAIAVGAPAVTLLALLVQAPADTQHDDARHEPTTHALTSADLFCPASDRGPIRIASASTSADPGSLTQRKPGGTRTPLALAVGGTRTVSSPDGLLLHAEGGLAPGLVGARLGEPRPAARECTAPGGVRWFVGAGSGASHLSTLTLANPDGGPAVADITIWSTDGQLQDIQSRGLTISGGKVSTLSLESLAPDAHELAVRVVVSRGRLAASMRDEFGKVGEALRADALPAGASPSREQVVPGLTRKASSRVLTLVNPGTSEAQVTLGIAGARSTFAPSGVGQIRVPAGKVVVTDLTKALEKVTGSEDTSLVVRSTVPVAAGVRAVVAGDLVHHPAIQLRTGLLSSVVPDVGTPTLVLTAGDTTGKVTVRWDGGRETTLEINAGTTLAVAAPRHAHLVTVDADVPVASVVRTQTKDGAALLPLRAVATELLVPAVRPAWPPR
ncbi:DUF5719 family protein [Nocardioides jiangxiensis]|uniref:DUF5719 family protein n=1 Tax=Nocardioides jiangxiensis TaxID=3064524 RepID=A0ABT9B2H6_9ACTN|nr:DUF5719 family protein [Nocardioides sp. WY-20]MDO7867481.1 DUF5719 family protein [Nocardioides sp. WY-20]